MKTHQTARVPTGGKPPMSAKQKYRVGYSSRENIKSVFKHADDASLIFEKCF
jgi:hypothetical protein